MTAVTPALFEMPPLKANPFPLETFKGERPPAPQWYRELSNEVPRELRIQVAGASVELLAWGDSSKPVVVLVHGARAHAHWWGPLAPLLAKDFHVVALSLSGMGGSDWRDRYCDDYHVQEILCATHATGVRDVTSVPPMIIAHSFGARAATRAAILDGDRLGGVILLDAGLGKVSHVGRTRQARRFPTLQAALSRFRLEPPQDCENLFILDDIARHSLVETETGEWSWRFDPDFWTKFAFDPTPIELGRVQCPLTFIYAERSPLRERVDWQRAHAPIGTPFTEFPQAGHHLMLDQPLGLAAALRVALMELGRRWHLPS